MNGYLKLSLVFVVLFFCASILPAQYQAGDWIELKTIKPSGVPLHAQPTSSFTGERALDGSKAQILELADGGHWLKIKLEDGREGWIIERYVVGEINPPIITVPKPDDTTPGTASDDDWLVWGAGQACLGVIGEGKRLFPNSNQMIRVGTWNVRFFPDETNLEWLACSITWMNVDILAVQEFRHTKEAKTALKKLITMLNTHTNGDWQYDLNQCGPDDNQHVGFLWNKSRLQVTDQKDMWQFNARASAESSPCEDNLRPGRYCYVQSKQGGVNFHLITVHTKSGAQVAAQQERYKALDNIDNAVEHLLVKDKDIIILGDFNTMGNGNNGSKEIELANFKQICLDEAPGFIQLQAKPTCSEYYKGDGGWLDQILVSSEMIELPSQVSYVQGYCKVKSCYHIEGTMPVAYAELSDHCPTIIEIIDENLDK